MDQQDSHRSDQHEELVIMFAKIAHAVRWFFSNPAAYNTKWS